MSAVSGWRQRGDAARHALRVQARDLLELWLLPGLAALLPWRWCFALYRRLARWPWLYRAKLELALPQARARLQLSEPQWREWAQQHRLVTLVDHADCFLSRTRGAGWLRRHVEVRGAWPAPGESAVLCTFHWGAGTWALRHARQAGMQAHKLVAGLDTPAYRGRPVMLRYARTRLAMVRHALGQPTLDTSAPLRALLQCLQQRHQVLAVMDVPADEVSASCEVELLGETALMPRGLLRLAVQRRLPVVMFLCGIDLASGRRWIEIETVPPHDEVPALAAALFAHLDAAIRAQPAQWHFWAQAPRFWQRAGPMA
ncbi:hypothetical protein [Ottowia sp.]|jgi:lauroyl/myristoyl acyltransferase|uniref:hypothetical protein n=1 Tax=Ottowia sp. TaxID=1898956 RepID=UPI002B8281C1|nr:hypothetical protein [Ottowia sp.]HRN75283.1 hypothetical protein [Ottowia sp.]HRQ02481.1 hypothetical protein [Ottowia sp.]